MSHPLFYHYVKASSLVPQEQLDAVYRDLISGRPIGAAPLAYRADMRYLQHTARLRYGVERFGEVLLQPEEEMRDDSSASLDGESSDADRRLSEEDRQLADALIRQGLLNSWQSAQLLLGRTKFTLGSYQILDAIGKGGYGHVFLGCDRHKTRHSGAKESFVALKVLPLSKTTPEQSERFLHEIEIQKILSHPNLVRYIDSGRDGNVHFMVHEFVDGGDVKQLLKREETLCIDVAVSILYSIAEAVAYLHERGIIHRDIKPANILLSSDARARLADLGLAIAYDKYTLPMNQSPQLSGILEKQIERAAQSTGKVAGTVDYMAPDQITDPNTPTPAWDIYSLGCTFYQLLTGTVPFPYGNSRKKFQSHLKVKPRDPRVLNPQIPLDLTLLLQEMLEKDPLRRIHSAEAILDRLRPWLPPEGIGDQLVFCDINQYYDEPPLVPFGRVGLS